MGQCLPKPYWSKFMKEKCQISNRFVRRARIREYGPVSAKALLEQIHKGKVLVFSQPERMTALSLFSSGLQEVFGASPGSGLQDLLRICIFCIFGTVTAFCYFYIENVGFP